jgi:protein-S-isoprenylcysteine O-methyltransferase Ste14
MTVAAPLVFWTLLVLGPIPFWHLLLHLFLPSWKRRPGAFYGTAGILWGSFLPIAYLLALQSSPLFVPPRELRLACLAASLVAFGVAAWSMVTLTPRRFFLWAVLRPRETPAEWIRSGPYRFTAHPCYVAMVATMASSFLASGEAVLAGALGVLATLLVVVGILEQRELRARVTPPLAQRGAAPALDRSSDPTLAPIAMGTDDAD